MYPILFEIPLPEFLHGFLGESFTAYSYGFFIVIGALLGVTYVAVQSRKKFDLSLDKVNSLFLLLLLAAFVGGKVFLYFENPAYYNNNMANLLSGKGFVFYGSLLFCIPSMLLFFRYHKLTTLPMLDIMAVTTCIVHAFGRLGCFMAGCCHGIEWHGPLAVVFTNEECLAPTNIPLHPTQLYSIGLISVILVTLLVIKKNKQFEGQLFLLYLMFYSVGRSIIEIFRGDVSRGYVIDGWLSHSQFISLIILSITIYFYIKLKKRVGVTSK
ncbi:prolipoprotein diacylglyceryl transferase [Fulvivirga sp. RKSG066]|uniref:prolipoprotein diacylglyceryl transferase n=1 Tax=Fulvivirga aurantia TaxID=2529383 RepID=UPI0012BBBFDB|nr:prolipoprotein diacylglyceryl transferase family protein [Fulvivirga aurantia]MTI21670.1 prolipoprotein diacylglyceryl transferase [Fulvivirga aurantia]